MHLLHKCTASMDLSLNKTNGDSLRIDNHDGLWPQVSGEDDEDALAEADKLLEQLDLLSSD